jgi:BirA family biotin operon repressor/biotin-[acetyl-CoA-carboxylase] ligase
MAMSERRPQDRLDAEAIRAGIVPSIQARLKHVTVLSQTDSTNSVIQGMSGDLQHAHAVVAEHQTSGRGRRQKTWHSPAGGNIYLSLGWRLGNTVGPLSTLPLVVAVAVCRTLDRAGLQGHGIKWPNDILINGKKLAGILVEMQSSGQGQALAVIGVGLNVRMPRSGRGDTLEGVIGQPWTDLSSELEVSNGLTSRNQLTALLLEELLTALDGFEANGFTAFRNDWEKRDVLYGRKIKLEHNGSMTKGEARGVDSSGGLLLNTGSTDTRVFHSGEVSVHNE